MAAEKRKSLLIINSCLPIERCDGSLLVRDGFSSYSVGIARELKSAYEVTVISPGSESSFEHEGVRYINRGRQSRLSNLVGNLEFWQDTLGFLLDHEFDVIIVHSAVTAFLSSISDVLRARCIGIIHDTHPGDCGILFNFWRDLWLRRSRRLDLIFSDNLSDRDRLLRKYGFSPQRVHCTGVGTDPSRYQFSAEKENRLVFVGRFVRSKNIGPLVDALGPLLTGDDERRLVLIGSGVLRGEIEGAIARGGLGRSVEVRGGLNDEQKIAELRKSKIYVSLSQIEGFGMSVVEAMACGAVPVVSDIPAHRFIFQERAVGFLVKDASELQSRISWLLQDESARREMAERARALVEDAWTWRKVKDHYDRALAALPEKDPSPWERRLKRPVKIRLFKLFLALSYALLVRFDLLKARNDGK